MQAIPLQYQGGSLRLDNSVHGLHQDMYVLFYSPALYY